MNRLLTVFLLALATTVQADELRIDETDELIIVEYVGTPSAIAELADNESDYELRLENALADENQRQIEMYSKEVRRISGTSQPDEEPPNKQQNMSGV